MIDQRFIHANGEYGELTQCLMDRGFKSIFLVCDSAIKFLKLNEYFNDLNSKIKIIRFSDFEPNPDYTSVEKGVRLFLDNACDAIVTVGGGSAMDVAKCIKLFSSMNQSENYLSQEILPNEVPLIAIPTTSGTGSESTRYAVIYYNGEKQSVADNSIIPSVVLMDFSVLKTLPMYQKKATMMDAFSHSIESFWSVNSTDESKEYSKTALKLILKSMDSYLNNEDSGNEAMLSASNYAGKAINITQTTAGHAMCYKITSLYGTSHGHAAALCMVKLWRYMSNNLDKCSDSRGRDYLAKIFSEMAEAMGEKTTLDAIDRVEAIMDKLELKAPILKDGDLDILINSVNPVRLKNNPVKLEKEDIKYIYQKIFNII